MARADRLFRALLRLFPADFRGDFSEEMAATFAEQHKEGRFVYKRDVRIESHAPLQRR